MPNLKPEDLKPAPSLFGLTNSNRDFNNKEYWGKNQFNNTFPAALACYMDSKSFKPVYIQLGKNLKVLHGNIPVPDIFGLKPSSPKLFFSFESEYTPYKPLVTGKLPRVDLVTMKVDDEKSEDLKPIEIKLTTLPDNQTSDLTEEFYGCEIVVRPDSIVYLALSMAQTYEGHEQELLKHLQSIFGQKINWQSSEAVLPLVHKIALALDAIVLNKVSEQKPFLMQPIWKTKGKSSVLAENCLDMFIWTDLAFTRLFVDVSKNHPSPAKMTRALRSVVWLGAMLYDFAKTGKIDHQKIIDELTYGTKNDKAFAIGGILTHYYMKSPELLRPRVTKDEIKNIILGGGQELLSPERRFDGVVINSFFN